MNDLFGETVAEIGLWIGAEIRERESHYGRFSERSRGSAGGVGLNRSFTKDRRITSLREIDDESICGTFG